MIKSNKRRSRGAQGDLLTEGLNELFRSLNPYQQIKKRKDGRRKSRLSK